MRIFDGIDDVESAVGTSLGHSSWFRVTQTAVDEFAEVTGDRQWIHVDPLRAAEGPFGSTVAHGYLTLAMTPRFTDQVFQVNGISAIVNYGSNRVRYPSPVPVNSSLRGSVDVVDLERREDDAMLTIRVTIEREGDPKPACVVESLLLLVP